MKKEAVASFAFCYSPFIVSTDVDDVVEVRRIELLSEDSDL